MNRILNYLKKYKFNSLINKQTFYKGKVNTYKFNKKNYQYIIKRKFYSSPLNLNENKNSEPPNDFKWILIASICCGSLVKIMESYK